MADLTIDQNQILQDLDNIVVTWPRVGYFISKVLDEVLYKKWGYNDFMEYSEKELKLHYSIAHQILDSAMFMKKWKSELFLDFLERGSTERKLPSYMEVLLLSKKQQTLERKKEFHLLTEKVFETVLDSHQIEEALEYIEFPGKTKPKKGIAGLLGQKEARAATFEEFLEQLINTKKQRAQPKKGSTHGGIVGSRPQPFEASKLSKEATRSIIIKATIAIVVLIVIFVFYKLTKQSKEEANLKKLSMLMKDAKVYEQKRIWRKALEYYLKAKEYTNSSNVAQVDNAIDYIQKMRQKIQSAKNTLMKSYRVAEKSLLEKEYSKAYNNYINVQDIYTKNERDIGEDASIKGIISDLPKKIAVALKERNREKLKKKIFEDIYRKAMIAEEGKRWKEAYFAYKKALEKSPDTLSKVEILKIQMKIKKMKGKYQVYKQRLFEIKQKSKGLIKYKGKWITYDAKMRAEGFKKFQNKWVSAKLYKALSIKVNKIKKELRILQNFLLAYKKKEDKNIVVIMKDESEYKGKFLRSAKRYIKVKVHIKKYRGYVERKFYKHNIEKIKLQNPKYQDFFAKLKKVKYMSDYQAIIDWCEKIKFKKGITLIKYKIFLRDFTNSKTNIMKIKKLRGRYFLDTE